MMAIRHTGATTRQIKKAPRGALFIWVTNDVTYPRKLADELGRLDLHIAGRGALSIHKLSGESRPIVVDHAVMPNTSLEIQAFDLIDIINDKYKATNETNETN